MVSAITGGLVAAVKWLFTSVLGKSILKFSGKIVFLGIFLLALAYAGMLPQSPFGVAIPILQGFINQIPYFKYVSFFVPFGQIGSIGILWISAITGFHVIKVILRRGGIIR